MNQLFEASAINSMELANRFVRSATWEALATESGQCTAPLIELMAALAKGGVGLIISGHAYISPEGKAGPAQLGVYSDELLPGLRQMTAAVHENDGKIVMQLAHAGMMADLPPDGPHPLGPSVVKGIGSPKTRQMNNEEIRALIKAFCAAAARAQNAGFDGVQIHAAHGYLLSQFLSPLFNRRRDQYVCVWVE